MSYPMLRVSRFQCGAYCPRIIETLPVKVSIGFQLETGILATKMASAVSKSFKNSFKIYGFNTVSGVQGGNGNTLSSYLKSHGGNLGLRISHMRYCPADGVIPRSEYVT